MVNDNLQLTIDKLEQSNRELLQRLDKLTPKEDSRDPTSLMSQLQKERETSERLRQQIETFVNSYGEFCASEKGLPKTQAPVAARKRSA